MPSSVVSLVATGDVTDINCHSNIPYFFFREGKAHNFFTDPVRLDLNLFKWPRRIWNLKQLVMGQGIGGYQYSDHFLAQVEQQIPKSLLKGLMISINQLFPRIETIQRHGGEVIYYIDATLRDLVSNLSYGIQIPDKVLAKAYVQERRNYEGARYVITRSSWIIPTLVDFYHIDPSKIKHIPPGANLDLSSDFSPVAFAKGAGIDREFVLGFVGKDWKRKGLGLLVEVRDILVARGYKTIIKVIGSVPEEMKDKKGLEFTGFIDKHQQMQRFVQEISTCDIGCLFSESEGFGISVLEFLRVGVPVAGFYHQGLRDTLVHGASLRFQFPSSPSSIADGFQSYLDNIEQQLTMKSRALEHAEMVTWASTVVQFKSLINVES